MTATAPTRAAAREVDRTPPAPDITRTRLRAAGGIGQLAYGVLRLRRTGHGWYHVALGARQLVQAKLDGAGAFSPTADAAVDSLHAASMVLVALVRRRRRREAALGAAHALAWALADAALDRADRADRARRAHASSA
jgi:hypothetical protein